MTPSPMLKEMIALAHRAGAAVMEIYARGAEARLKDDRSPVTEADLVSERVILEGLRRIAPEIPVISEEATAEGQEPVAGKRFFLVDPLDGTKEFLNRNGEFTINIALVEDGAPKLGVVYAPALGRLFWGECGEGACHAKILHDQVLLQDGWRPIKVRARPEADVIVVASRSHRDAETEAWLKSWKIAELVSAGSSLKFCLLATGEADLYPRFGRAR